MDENELDFIIKQGEGQFIEFKENVDKSLSKEIVAFANAQGGKIYLGVTDKGELKGLGITNKLKSAIQDIARNCDPSIFIELKVINDILIVDVKEGLNKPYRCSFGFFIRSGSNSQKLSTDEIRDFFNSEGKILFDEAIDTDFNFDKGFDNSKFNIFLQEAKISRVIPDKDILKNLGILNEDEKFKNAGVLFFCENIEKYFRQAIITCVLYKGNDKYKILDRKDFTDDILLNYDNIMAFLFHFGFNTPELCSDYILIVLI